MGLQSDDELIKAEAWRRFHESYRPIIYSYLRHRKFHHEDADDITQDVMVTIERRIGSFELQPELGALRDWIAVIVRSRATDFVRRNRRHEAGRVTGLTSEEFAHSKFHPFEASFASQLDHYIQVICIRQVEASLQDKPDALASWRRVWNGEKVGVIAADLGRTPDWVYSQSAEADKLLYDIMMRDWGGILQIGN